MAGALEQMVAAAAAVGVLLGLNILQIEAKRVTIDLSLAGPAVSATSRPGTTSWQEYLITQGTLLSVELGPSEDWEREVEAPDTRPAPRAVRD